MMQIARPRRALGLYLAACAALTLGPLPRRPLDLAVSASQALFGLSVGSGANPTHAQVEGVANVLLFIPIGFLLGRASPRGPRWRLLAVTAVGSAVIEIVQHTLLTGRYSNVRDVLLNSLGSAIGLVAAGRRSADVPAGSTS